MLEIVEAPNESKHNYRRLKLFLAGGITNCPDWQKIIIEKLQKVENEYDKEVIDILTIFNPRRENFPIHDPNASKEQITWEYEKLVESDIIVFWFSNGSLNPIVLYELGLHGNSNPYKRIVIGCDNEYPRKSDVEIQTELARPDQIITHSLDEFFEEIIKAIHDEMVIFEEE